MDNIKKNKKCVNSVDVFHIFSTSIYSKRPTYAENIYWDTSQESECKFNIACSALWFCIHVYFFTVFDVSTKVLDISNNYMSAAIWLHFRSKILIFWNNKRLL